MHIFDYSFLENDLLPAKFINLVSSVSVFNAISNERKNNYPAIYTELNKIARIQSIKGSNAIEGIVTSDERIISIISGECAPLNHDEKEIIGYRNALDIIHTRYNNLSINEETILMLHKVMTETAEYSLSGKYKTDDNMIIEVDIFGKRHIRFMPVKASEVKEAMEQLILAYSEASSNPKINKLLLIPCFILDFLCIHPFQDGNGRISRLLSLLLLYRNNYDIGKYISFEEQINNSKDYYYESLQNCSEGWHTNENTYWDFVDNFLSTMCKCYKELDKRISLSETRHLNKNERIKKTLLKSILPMSKSEICDLLPDVSPDTVSVVLTSMVKKGNIKKIGKARNTKYVNADYVN